MDKDRIAELIARYAWKDTIQEGGWQGFGWWQSVFAGADHFLIQATPQPDFLTYGEHGLLVMAVSGNTCLLTREFCDGRRADFAVSTSIRGVADLLVAGSHYKIGVAADALLEKLRGRHMLTAMQVKVCRQRPRPTSRPRSPIVPICTLWWTTIGDRRRLAAPPARTPFSRFPAKRQYPLRVPRPYVCAGC